MSCDGSAARTTSRAAAAHDTTHGLIASGVIRAKARVEDVANRLC